MATLRVLLGVTLLAIGLILTYGFAVLGERTAQLVTLAATVGASVYLLMPRRK